MAKRSRSPSPSPSPKPTTPLEEDATQVAKKPRPSEPALSLVPYDATATYWLVTHVDEEGDLSYALFDPASLPTADARDAMFKAIGYCATDLRNLEPDVDEESSLRGHWTDMPDDETLAQHPLKIGKVYSFACDGFAQAVSDMLTQI
jgi:hypothetical protein